MSQPGERRDDERRQHDHEVAIPEVLRAEPRRDQIADHHGPGRIAEVRHERPEPVQTDDQPDRRPRRVRQPRHEREGEEGDAGEAADRPRDQRLPVAGGVGRARAREERHGAEQVLDGRQEAQLARARSVGEGIEDDEAEVEVLADGGEEPVQPRPPDPGQPARRQRLVVQSRRDLGVLQRVPVQPVGPQVIQAAHAPLDEVLMPAARGERSPRREDEAIQPGEPRSPATGWRSPRHGDRWDRAAQELDWTPCRARGVAGRGDGRGAASRCSRLVVLTGWIGYELWTWPRVAELDTRPPRTTAFIERYRAEQRAAGRPDRVHGPGCRTPRSRPT